VYSSRELVLLWCSDTHGQIDIKILHVMCYYYIMVWVSRLCHFLDHIMYIIDDHRLVVVTKMSKNKSLWHVLWCSLSAVLILLCCDGRVGTLMLVLEVLLFVRCGEVLFER
jgi:hypothetical protein